jgi:hypothetical protein
MNSQLNSKQLAEEYTRIILSNISFLLDRYEMDRDYPFIDMKFSTFDRTDFSDAVRGKDVIYSWIQGRGMEALAGHFEWLQGAVGIDTAIKDDLSQRIHKVLGEVTGNMESLRAANGGRLFFMMDCKGRPLRPGDSGRLESYDISVNSPANFSDLFYVKGLAAAAVVLGQDDKLHDACNWFSQIDKDISTDIFVSDQQSLDPDNMAIKQVPGRYSHGSRMIAVGAAARFLECTQDSIYRDIGISYISYIMQHHINTEGNADNALLYDMWEFIDDNGNPYIDEAGALLSDPGHACEFVGLSLKLLRLAGLKTYTDILPKILSRNFENGFYSDGYGVCKAVNLISRDVMNSTMPWWSLPETIRAGFEARRVVTGKEKIAIDIIIDKCTKAYLQYYVQPDFHYVAYQTLGNDGRPVDVIPATPDADPGYHTGLSLIDCM